MKRLLFYICLIFLVICIPNTLAASEAHYVDCTHGGSNVGTFANPFQSIDDVNDHAMIAGDDVYFAVNTTCTLDAADNRLYIDWNGNGAGDPTVIGAYYGDGQFGLNGNARPILDGINTYPVSAIHEGNLITNKKTNDPKWSYIQIKDLRANNSNAHGIKLREIDYGLIDNCYSNHSYKVGLSLGKCTYSTLSNSIADDAYWDGFTNGDGIDISGGGVTDSSHNNTISGNIVRNCNEGLGIYNKNRDIIVENNVLYDNWKYNLYVDVGKQITIRYNLIYTSTTGEAEKGTGTRGICVDNETSRGYCYAPEDILIYGNLIANMTQGIFISNNYGYDIDTTCNNSGILVYNNTLVDNDLNFNIVRDDAGWTGNEIKNNISWTISSGTVHINNCALVGFTFDYNLWDDDPGTGICDDAQDPTNSSPLLSKSSGWRSLTVGSVDGTEFTPLPTSPAINNGIAIASYNNRIKASDFTASPITVTTYDDSSNPDIGAWAYEGIPASSSPQPSGEQPCSEDPIPISIQITADKYSDFQWCKDGDGGCDSASVYGGDTMAAMEVTGTELSTHGVTEACDQAAVKYWSIGRNHFTLQEQTAPTAHDFSTGGGAAPQYGGAGAMVTIGTVKNMDITGTTKNLDLQ